MATAALNGLVRLSCGAQTVIIHGASCALGIVHTHLHTYTHRHAHTHTHTHTLGHSGLKSRLFFCFFFRLPETNCTRLQRAAQHDVFLLRRRVQAQTHIHTDTQIHLQRHAQASTEMHRTVFMGLFHLTATESGS